MISSGSYRLLSQPFFSHTSGSLFSLIDRECNLCKDPSQAVNWNHPLSYDGLASTCLNVYMNLRNEMVQDGDETCLSVRYTVSNECCYKIPTNQCSLCQHVNGTYLNTNWNSEVTYQGEVVTCGDVNALLSAEELDGLLCQSAREDLWSQCCTPQEGGNTGIGGILPPPKPEDSSDSDQAGQSSWDSNTNDGGFGSIALIRRNASQSLHPSVFTMVLLAGVGFVSHLNNT